MPSIELGNIHGMCEGSTLLLQPGNYASYLWQDGSTFPSFTVSAPGNYFVTVTDSNLCKASDTVAINSLFCPPINFLPADTAICGGTIFLLTTMNNYSSYLWNTNMTSSTLNISVSGMYWAEVRDGNGCEGKDSINIVLKDCLDGFYIPNAFTQMATD